MRSEHERRSLVYRAVMVLVTPVVRWWGRLVVVGADVLPPTGPLLVIANHDSQWDPLIVGVAARTRQVRALAKASLWKSRPVAVVLDQMGQIPIERGRGDLTAMSAAVEALRSGRCVGVFPEGTISRGRTMRPLSGAGRLAVAVPEAPVVAVSITGAVDIVRFPRRPRITVTFFRPRGGPPREGESAVSVTKRVMAEVRELAPYAVCGRSATAARLLAEARQDQPD